MMRPDEHVDELILNIPTTNRLPFDSHGCRAATVTPVGAVTRPRRGPSHSPGVAAKRRPPDPDHRSPPPAGVAALPRWTTSRCHFENQTPKGSQPLAGGRSEAQTPGTPEPPN